MNSGPQKFIAKIPSLDLPKDRTMLREFTAEALSHLVSAENSVFALETFAYDRESIDNIFKVFHTIAGLSGFFDLEDIQCLSSETQALIDMVRKGTLMFSGDVADIVSQAISGLRQFLILLNEQMENNGELKSPYYDAGAVIGLIRDALTDKKTVRPLKPKRQFNEKLNIVAEELMGRYRQVESEIKNQTGDITLHADVLRDMIHDMKEAHEELRHMKATLVQRQRDAIREKEFALKATQQAQDTARTKSDFLASMAHEIRTLINTILGFSQLLMKSPLSTEQKDHLKVVVTSGRLLLDVVNNILDFSKLERGKLTLENIDFRLDALVEDIFKILKPKIEGKTIDLHFKIDHDVPLSFTGDPTKIKQILLNLLDNAIKFTEKGEVGLFVDLKKTAKRAVFPMNEQIICFTVHDTGIGIPRNKLDVIFESFTQADSSTTRRYGGSGLGLAICKGYVKAMNGTISVESEVGKGSKFIFTITLRESKITKEADVESRDSAPDADFKGSCKGIKVLVADDSAPNQELMKACFEYLGCEGDFAANGQEAVDKVRRSDYDICFMDLQMPLMDGFEATQIIRRNIKKNFPIIALTAASMEEKRSESQRAGITDYLEKPFDMIQLKEKIVQYVQR